MTQPALVERGTDDKIIRLVDAGKRLKLLGRTPSLPTLLRWIDTGRDGVVLQAFRIGKTWMTSEKRLQRFLAELARRDRRAS